MPTCTYCPREAVARVRFGVTALVVGLSVRLPPSADMCEPCIRGL